MLCIVRPRLSIVCLVADASVSSSSPVWTSGTGVCRSPWLRSKSLCVTIFKCLDMRSAMMSIQAIPIPPITTADRKRMSNERFFSFS